MRIIAAMLIFTFATAVGAQASKADTDRALREIDAFTTMQARTDPHYSAVEDILLAEVDGILKTTPPREWAASIRRRYVSLSEGVHAKERAAVQASEVEIARTLGTGDAGWSARLTQLDEGVKTGTLGPRLHALRALEAAKLYHQGNNLFIAWRAAKVPVATEYELGAISRSEYDERWQSITSRFMDRQASEDRQRALIEAQVATEELRMQQEQARRAATPRPMVRCTTTTSFGVTETRCR
jgi:hypothetical protein